MPIEGVRCFIHSELDANAVCPSPAFTAGAKAFSRCIKKAIGEARRYAPEVKPELADHDSIEAFDKAVSQWRSSSIAAAHSAHRALIKAPDELAKLAAAAEAALGLADERFDTMNDKVYKALTSIGLSKQEIGVILPMVAPLATAARERDALRAELSSIRGLRRRWSVKAKPFVAEMNSILSKFA